MTPARSRRRNGLRDELCCYQELAPLLEVDSNRVVSGTWRVPRKWRLNLNESSGFTAAEYGCFLPLVMPYGTYLSPPLSTARS